MLKADAYGHGAVPVAAALERAGVDGFAVSLVEEGLELRRATRAPVLVLGGLYRDAHAEVLARDLTPVVFDLGDLERFSGATRSGRRVAVHVKVDTGMARLGVPLRELEAFLARAKGLGNLEIAGLCTHLASADGDEEEPTQAQLERFEEARAVAERLGVAPRWLHAANSAGAVRYREARYDLVRPGIALLGDAAAPRVDLPGARPVLRLTTRVLALRDLEAGQTVSYGGLFRASRPTRIATLPLGYADGYPRRLSGTGEVLVGGRRARVAGAVCMDMFMVDVTDLPAVRAGDEVVLLGEQQGERITARDWARWAGTVNYEVYCGISKRVPRVYSG